MWGWDLGFLHGSIGTIRVPFKEAYPGVGIEGWGFYKGAARAGCITLLQNLT